MKINKPLLLLLLVISFSNFCTAGRYWIANTPSNWNNSANWSNVSGGAGGFSVPGVADDVNFDNLGTGNCTIDATVNIKSITVTALYSGNIIQGANSIAVVNAAAFAGGTFTGGSANINITGMFTIAGAIFTATSGVLDIRNNMAFTGGVFSHNNGTVRFNGIGSVAITGTSPVFFNLEFVGNGNTYTLSSAGNITVMGSLNTSGTLFYNISTGTIDVNGDINSNNSAPGCGGDAMININGTGVQNFAGSAAAGTGAMPQLTINKTSGILNLSNFPGISNNFTYITGTINTGSSVFCFTHGNTGSYNITGSFSFANIEFIVNTSLLTLTIPVGTTLTATGDLTIAGAGNLVINTGNVNVNGNITLTNTGNGGGGSATINITGTGSQNLDGTALILNQSRLPVININKASGTLFLSGNISFASNVTYASGIVNAGVSTCYIVNNLTMTGSFALYNLSISPAGNTNFTIAAGTTITATNLLDLENAGNFISLNTGTIAVQGNIIDNNTSLTGGGNATILINGSGTQTITTTGVIDQGRLPALTINKPSGTLVMPALMTIRSDWNYIAGALDVSTNNSTVVFENTMSINGTATLNNIIFDGSNNYNFTTGAATTITVLGNISMIGTGNITLNTGTFNLSGNLLLSNTGGGGGSSVISFTGSGNQAITSALPINQNCLPSITINKPAGTLLFPNLITVRGNWVYTAGTMDLSTNNATIAFADPLGIGLWGITGTHTLNNVIFEAVSNSTLTVSTGTILTINGTMTTAGSANIYFNTTVAGATAIQALGNIIINNTAAGGGGNGQILINGTGNQLFSSTAAAGQGWMPLLTIQKITGTLTLSGIITESRNWTYTSGIVDAVTNATTVVFGGNNLTVSSGTMNFYHVIVNANTATLTGNLVVKGNLTVNGTGILAPGANTIFLAGNWTDRSTAGFTEATSTVNFNGAITQTITTPGGENFNNMVVNNTGSGMQLINDATVAAVLNMTQGNLDLNSKTLTLGISAASNGTLSRTAGTLINTGIFTRWFKTGVIATASAAGLFPMGTATDYRPLYITAPVSGPTTGGTVAVSYANAGTNSAVAISDPPFTAVLRKDLNWAVTSTGLAGGLYDLQVQGTGFGLISALTDLRLTLAAGIVGLPGVNAGSLINPQVVRTGLSAANLSNNFYLSSINPLTSLLLPVKLIYFNAVVKNNQVALSWETSTELNNDHFTVQRSADGRGWIDIARIAGVGNSNLNHTYSSYDTNPLQGISYYRLAQTDLDGKNFLSGIKRIDIANLIVVTGYPNPAMDNYYLRSAANIEKIKVFNASGQEISCPVTRSTNNLVIGISHLVKGLYFIDVKTAGSEIKTCSFIKK
jgi:hypothetical protein